MNLHPIARINKNFARTIKLLEKKHTVSELINWSEITADIYMLEENENEKYYRSYNAELSVLIVRCSEVSEMSAEKAFEKSDIKWRYE